MQLDYIYRDGETRLRMSLAKTLALNKSHSSEDIGRGCLVLEELGNFSFNHLRTHYKFSFLSPFLQEIGSSWGVWNKHVPVHLEMRHLHFLLRDVFF